MTALETLDRRIDERLFGAFGESRDARLYRRMRFIRRFEETLLALFEEGLLNGTTHACIGQEADSVGLIEHLRDGDHLFSNHRCHGHFLAWTGDAFGLLAEIMGKPAGLCAGIGGSQHICAPGFKSNGVQGGIVPAAAGIALAEQLRGSDGLSVVFLGDGTLGEGIVYETLNLTALWQLPLLLVLEDNGWSQSTPSSLNLAGDIAARFTAFGLPVVEVETTDVLEIEAAAGDAVCGMSRAARSRRARSSIPTASAITPRTTTTGRSKRSSCGGGSTRSSCMGSGWTRTSVTAIDTGGRRGPGGLRDPGEAAVIYARALGDTLRHTLDVRSSRGHARRGHPRPLRGRFQGHARAEHRLPGARAGDADQRSRDRRRLCRTRSGRLSPDRGDHVRRLPAAVLRPDRKSHREVRGDVQRRRQVPGRDPNPVWRRTGLRPHPQPEPRKALPRHPAPARRRGVAMA